MKIIKWFIDQFGIGGLVIGSIFSFITAIILLLSIIFNFPPYIPFSKGNEGIPVEVNIPLSITFPDTSIVIETKKGNSGIFDLNNTVEEKLLLPKNDSIIYSDTIFSDIRFWGSNNKKNPVITSFEMQSGKVYIKPEKFSQRLILSLPILLKFLLIGFCAWQIAMVLSFIRTGEAFNNKNYRRVASVGWSLIIYALGLFLIKLLFEPDFTSMDILFNSSIPNYREPISLHGNTSAQLNFSWIIIGCVFLITAQAFQKGYKLQQEQDLTI